MLKTVRLKPSNAKPLKASAWFLPGDDVSLWLNETARWTTETHRLKFYLIPAPQSAATAGVLVIPPPDTTLPSGSRGQPYGEPAPGFFIPIDAVFSPPITQAELKSLTLHPVSVFHPTLGLVGFGESEFKRASDFLRLRVIDSENWSAARTTPPINRRLRSVRLEATISLSDVFGEESRDIGSEPLIDLPPTAGEPRDSLPGKIAQGAAGALARALAGLTSLVPRSAGVSPNWINHLENWAQQKLSGITADLERQRNKELHRLLELLEKDPEQALRHAISLAALLNRGKAPPSSQLANRDPNFRLSRLGGGPSDAWSVPADLQSALASRYRENAQRELKLGRYRRAAYIYAELLGDFTLAADALKQGKFFREAAVLYKERLFKPLLAAECLAGGGLIEEAIEIYEKHEHWLEAADLYERIADQEKARAAIRRAVDALLKKGDVIGAARLIESRLQSPDEALVLLASAWPAGKQAIACLEERIALLSRLHRSADLRALVVRLGQETAPARHATDLISLLARTSEHAVSAEIRRLAAEAVRIRASAALSEPLIERSDELAILRALTRLVPHDRLLSRDVNRYRERRPSALPPRLPPPSNSNLIRRLTLEKTKPLNLPKVGNWIRAEGNAHGFGAVSRRDGQRLFFTRSTWDAAQQSADWTDPAPAMESAFFLKICANDFLLGRPFSTGLKMTDLPGTGVFNHIAASVGTPEWMPEDTVQITASKGAIWSARVVTSRLILTSFHAGKQVHSQDVTDQLVAAGASGGGNTLFLDGLGGQNCIAMGYGNCLLVMTSSRQIDVRKFDQQVTGVLPSHPSLPGWIVTLEKGAAFVSAWKLTVTALDDTMPSPRGAFLGDGRLVLIGAEEGKIFQRHDGKWLPTGWFSAPSEAASAIALTGTDQAREFALFQPSGAIQRWSVPA
jgi:tetratricopeptide (TPR) repeat protein